MNVKGRSELAVIFRDMLVSDLTRVVQLERAIFVDPWPRSAFEDQFGDGKWHSLVGETEGRVISYACFLIAAEECHLANIAVDPHYRRKSVAKQLLNRILGIAVDSGCKLILLEVRASNEPAIAFYRRVGFEDLYIRPNYYHNPTESALVMIRHLDAASVSD